MSLPTRTKGLTLIVDDDLLSIRMAKLVLKRRGFPGEIISASSVTSAFGILSADTQNKIDLVLLDVHLGLDSGFDLIEALRAFNNHKALQTTFVILSGSADPKVFAKLAKFPEIVGIIEKPLRAQNIAELARDRGWPMEKAA